MKPSLAVCSWSLQPENVADLVGKMTATGLRHLQIALDPLREAPAQWENFAPTLASNQFTLVSGMFGTVGEDYSTLDSIRRTGGLVPDETWQENWENIQEVADMAEQLGLKLVTFHSGFLPPQPESAAYQALLHRLRLVADVFGSKRIELGLETGQENAPTLARFLQTLGRPNVGVNFDPANMILYNEGDPVESLKMLLPWLRQCHLKDATRTRKPGTWGEEVVVGTGEVDWPRFFQVLKDFSGYYVIEREAGSNRVEDVRQARKFVEPLLSQPS